MDELIEEYNSKYHITNSYYKLIRRSEFETII